MTVSYTHLDVYKRQVGIAVKGHPQGIAPGKDTGGHIIDMDNAAAIIDVVPVRPIGDKGGLLETPSEDQGGSLRGGPVGAVDHDGELRIRTKATGPYAVSYTHLLLV